VRAKEGRREEEAAGMVAGLCKVKARDARMAREADEMARDTAAVEAPTGTFVPGFSVGRKDRCQGAAVPAVPSRSHMG
jgi:hypothetical protein